VIFAIQRDILLMHALNYKGVVHVFFPTKVKASMKHSQKLTMKDEEVVPTSRKDLEKILQNLTNQHINHVLKIEQIVF